MSINLNALDDMDSLLCTSVGGTVHGFSYTPFGSTRTCDGNNSLLPGFNGERLDPVSQTYHLGNGYRTYNPALMRFSAPDSWSPFGAGGLNQYAYCEGDPINRADPSGHMSWQAGVGIGLGILGILGAVFTFGQSLAAAAAAEAAMTASMAADLIATGLGVAACVTSIASDATEESNPEASQILGWVSFGLGIAGAAAGVADAGKAIHGKFKKKIGSIDLLERSGNLADDARHGPQSDPIGRHPEQASPSVVDVDGKSFSIAPNSTGRPTRKAVVISHGRFQPLQRYLTGTADVAIPDGLHVMHHARHGEAMTGHDAMISMSKLFRGQEVNSVKNYLGRSAFKNYTLRPMPEMQHIGNMSSGAFDMIRPVGVVHTQDIFEGVRRGILPYDEIHFFSCRSLRLTASWPI